MRAVELGSKEIAGDRREQANKVRRNGTCQRRRPAPVSCSRRPRNGGNRARWSEPCRPRSMRSRSPGGILATLPVSQIAGRGDTKTSDNSASQRGLVLNDLPDEPPGF